MSSYKGDRYRDCLEWLWFPQQRPDKTQTLYIVLPQATHTPVLQMKS